MEVFNIRRNANAIRAIARGSVKHHNYLLDKIVYADKDVLHHALNIIGITLNAALPGDPAYYAFSGKIVGVAGLVAGRVWLGNNGELTQVVPTVGIILCVGTILEDDSTLVLNIGHSIIRS